MPKILLAVDDSATMRKALEITFSGEDFRVLTAASQGDAMALLAENPDVILVDTMLGNEDGYAVGRELHAKSPSSTLLFLTSKSAPYDAARGAEAGASDFADKPFDTQQLLDKTRKAMAAAAEIPTATALVGHETAAAKAPPAPTTPASPAGAPAQAAAPAARPAAPRAATLVFGASGPPGSAVAGGAAPSAVAAAIAAAKAAPAAPAAPAASHPGTVRTAAAPPAPADPKPAPAARPAPVAAAAAPDHKATLVEGRASNTGDARAAAGMGAGAAVAEATAKLGPQLEQLGLSKAQVEAVLALSREIVERVVWEVVPPLAETLIKEELARLLKA